MVNVPLFGVVVFWVGLRGTAAGWWQMGVFTDDKCTQPFPATAKVRDHYWYDPTVVTGYSQDACMRQSFITRTKYLKIACSAGDNELKLYIYEDSSCSSQSPIAPFDLGCVLSGSKNGQSAYRMFTSNMECNLLHSHLSIQPLPGAPPLPPTYPAFTINVQPTVPPPAWVTTTSTTTPAGPVWSIHFYDDHACANFSGPSAVDKNPFIGSGTGCFPVLVHQDQYYLQQSGCAVDGSGTPTFKSYDDANCTHLVEQIHVPAQGTCTVFHYSMVAFCHSQSVTLAFAQISTIATRSTTMSTSVAASSTATTSTTAAVAASSSAATSTTAAVAPPPAAALPPAAAANSSATTSTTAAATTSATTSTTAAAAGSSASTSSTAAAAASASAATSTTAAAAASSSASTSTTAAAATTAVAAASGGATTSTTAAAPASSSASTSTTAAAAASSSATTSPIAASSSLPSPPATTSSGTASTVSTGQTVDVNKLKVKSAWGLFPVLVDAETGAVVAGKTPSDLPAGACPHKYEYDFDLESVHMDPNAAREEVQNALANAVGSPVTCITVDAAQSGETSSRRLTSRMHFEGLIGVLQELTEEDLENALGSIPFHDLACGGLHLPLEGCSVEEVKVANEHIHFLVGALSTTTTEMPWGLPWWVWFLICCLSLLVCAICCLPCLGGVASGGKKQKSSYEALDVVDPIEA